MTKESWRAMGGWDCRDRPFVKPEPYRLKQEKGRSLPSSTEEQARDVENSRKKTSV